jgi:hypothetical protein
LSVGVNRCIAVSAVAVVALFVTACSSGPNLTADRAAVTQAQHAVNTDRAELDRLQEESTKVVILCVADHCPTGVGAGSSNAQGTKVNQAHQRLEMAFLKLDAAEAKLSFDESGNR